MSEIYNIPSGKPLSVDVKKNVGNALTGPNPQPAPKTAKEAREQAVARLNKFAIEAPRPDILKYDKPFTFNSDVNGQNFDRYYAHPKFKQLGFSPFRDNESVYNQKSSLWDDTERAGKQWFPLAGLAVSGTFGNWDDLLSGKPDVDNAIEMERYMNIGSSSRDGFGAKALNFGVNSAYTFGVIGSIFAEEAVFAGLASTGVGSGVAAAGTAKNALRLGKAFERLADVFKAGSTLSEARKTWDAVGKVSRAVLPFQQTTNLFRKAERAKMGWDKMDDFAKAYHSFGSFYRDLREINLVTSEAKLEGGFVQNDVANELIKKFREKEGRDPNDNEVQGIYDQALKAGFKTSYANMAGIYASNKVVLNKLLKGIPGVAPLEHAASKSVRGSIVKNTDWLKTGKNPYEVLYGIGRVANKEYLKQSLKNIPKNGLRYLSANVMEGSQEVYQEAVAEAMKKYYIESYNDPSRAHQGFMKEALEHGLKSQMSGQGLEVFLSGFLMAGPIQVAGLALTKTGQYTQMLNLKRQEKAFTADPNNAGKENPYTKKLNEFKEWDTKVVTALNDLTKNKKEYFSKLYRNAKEQKDLADLYEDSVLNGDNKTAIDTRDDSLFAHIKTLRKSGTLDLFKEQLNSLSELSDEELAEAFNEKDGPNPVDNKTISQRIQTVLGRIDDIDKHLTEVEKIANPYDPKTNFFNWFGFEEARELIAYNDYSYKRTGDRMISIQEDIKKMMGSVGLDPMYADIANLFSVGRGGNILMGAVDNMGMETELDLLRQEIDNLKGATEPELVKKRNQLSAKRNTLQKLSVSVQNAVTAYKLLNAQNLTDEEKQDNIERVTEAEKLLYDAFKDHLTTAATRGAAGAAMGIFDKTIDQLFEKYKDYWKLDADKANIANAINMLYNPEVFGQSVERLSNAAAEADSVKAEQAKKMAVEYQKRYATNDFLNDLLSQFNVFVSEEEAEAYLNNDIVPTKFINADTGYEIDPRRDAEKYNKILDLIDQYDEIFFERTGQRLFKPTREDIGARIAGTITGTDKEISELVPEFQAGDKRTLTDLAAEYGFDKGRNESQVKLDTILNAIISNKFATQAQKELARKLITLIDKTELVTFRSNHYTNSTYDTQNGIIIDPRYSSSDFGAKVSVPLEYSILNAAMQKVITDSLSDKTFADKISELRKLAVNGSNDTEKLLFKYAFANDRSFLGELLTNGDFQQHLANIEYTGEQTELTKEAATMWSKFLDILNDLLKNILNFNKSVYREAMAVTLNKLSQPSTGTKTTPTQPGPNTPSPSPIDVDKQDAELMKKLRDKYDAIIAGMSPEDASRMNFDSWMMSDSRALEITRKHKADKIRQQASGTQTGGAPLVTAAVKKNALTSIGFTIEEINAMSEDQIDDNYNKREELAKGFVTNLNREDWGDIDTQMNAAKEKAATLNLALTADSKQYVQYDESGNPIPGTERNRVSDVVKENKSSVNNVAAARGNIIDALYKKYLLGDIQSFEEFKKYYTEVQKKPKNAYVNFNDAMLEDLFDIVRNVQRELNKKGLKVIPDFPIISGMLGNIPTAGEMDILAYNKAGKIFIIDMKSSYTNRRLAYDVYNKMSAALGDKFTEFAKKLKDNEYFIKKTIDSYTDPAERALIEDKLDEILSKFPVEKSSLAEGNDVKAQIFYVIDDRAQQLAYKELLRQNTGLEVDSINIFPIITSTAKSSIMSQAQLEREILSITENEQGQNVIRVGGYSIAVDNSKTVYDLNLPKVTQTVTTYPENPIQKPGASTAQPTTTAGTFTPTTTYGTPTGPELTTATPTSTDAEVERINKITDPEERIVAEINYIMANLFSNVGEASANKIKEYADRIINGASRDSVIQGLPKSFVDAIDQLLAVQQAPVSTDAKADIEAAYSYITTRKYEGDRRDQVNKVGEDLAKRFVATLKERGLVKEDYRMAPRTDGSVERMKVNTDAEGNNLGNDWSTAGKFKEEFRKFVDAELAALEGGQQTTETTDKENAVKAAEELAVSNPSKAKNIQKDIVMMNESDAFIGSKVPETKSTYPSATEAYANGWGASANPQSFAGKTAVMISGSGTWNPAEAGGKITLEQIQNHFNSVYKPLIDQAIADGVTTFNVGNAAGMDKIVSDYLKQQGFVAESKDGWNKFAKLELQPKTYDNKPVAKSLQGKVIYITPDSYTVGDMAIHSENVVLGSDLVKEALLELDINTIKSRLEVLAQDKGKIGVSAKALLDFVNKNGINADNITGKGNFLYKLATLERDGDSSISSMIYPVALSKANAIVSDTNKTVVFDTPSVLPYGRIDLAILNGKSAFTVNAPITPTGRTGIADKEALFTGTKKRVMTDSSESIITGGPKSQIPKKLKDIRALINGINNKQELDNTMLMLETLGKTGVLEELLKDQNLSFDEYSALKNQKREQISKQLSIKDLVNKGENTLIRFLNKKNEERIGLVVGETEDNKLEIKDVTDEYNSGIQGKLFIDVDDLSYAGLGSKAKSLKLAERDVNEKVLGIMEEKKVDKSDTTTKQQSNSGQDAADQSVNERKQSLEGYDPFNKDQQKTNDEDLFSC